MKKMMNRSQGAASPSNDIELLLQAAEFLDNQDKRDRESEHGYAAPAYRYGNEPLRTKMKAIRRSQNRTSHNELEKNRRAHLRGCLENLKSIVPLSGDATRHTTLGLLNQASQLIKTLEEKNQQSEHEKSQLSKYNEQLKRTLQRLEVSRRRRNSTGSAWSSSHSESSNDSDKDEEIIDVTDCSDDAERLQAPVPLRSTNLITINVSKPLSLPARALAQIKRAKKVD
uniref:MAD Not7 protein n=1 Tax=Phallusia mammillata TaxID=59560 RepID=A0A6F9DM99_9ASCI|nr:MAD Not7 protein [Phallusia mammillata]